VAHHEHGNSSIVDPEPDPNRSALIGSPGSGSGFVLGMRTANGPKLKN
jgi:hypothetical protein